MKECPLRTEPGPASKRPCKHANCELWNEEESRCDFTSTADLLREIRDALTADKQPGYDIKTSEGEPLETLPLIPEFPADVSSDHCIEYGWWNLMEGCVFEAGRAENLREYYIREGFDVRLERVFGDGRTDEQFFRLWFRGKKTA